MTHPDSPTNGDSAPVTDTAAPSIALNHALERCGIAVFEMDFTTGLVSYISGLCNEQQGIPYPSEKLMTIEDRWRYIDPRDVPWIQEIFQQNMRNARPNDRVPIHYCYRRLRADGSSYWSEEWGTATFDEQVRPIKYAGINVDITERKETEDRLQQALDAKDKYLRLIVHDIRNPLTVLNSYLYLLMQTEVSPERRMDMLERMKRAVESLKHLADEIMKLEGEAYKQADVDPEIMDARAWLMDFCMQNRTMGAAKDIEVEFELPAMTMPVWMDPKAMERVMINLLSNAVKYSYPTSTIRVELTQSDETAWVMFAIHDQGVGIPPEKLRLVFEPFYTTGAKPTGGEQSIGLGLAVCKALVQAQGGRIWVESGGEGQGSSFFVQMSATTLPGLTRSNSGDGA